MIPIKDILLYQQSLPNQVIDTNTVTGNALALYIVRPLAGSSIIVKYKQSPVFFGELLQHVIIIIY